MIGNKPDDIQIELEYDEFYTQIQKLNKISELPDEINFKVSSFLKILMPLMIIGPAVAIGINLIIDERSLEGIVIMVISVIFYLYLYFVHHRKWDKEYVINRKGITVDKDFFDWEKIDDLHLYAAKANRGYIYSIRFTHDGISKIFELDTMTKSVGEIKQILYMYQRWWIKNTSNIEPL